MIELEICDKCGGETQYGFGLSSSSFTGHMGKRMVVQIALREFGDEKLACVCADCFYSMAHEVADSMMTNERVAKS